MTAPASLIFLADWSLFLPELDKQSKKLCLCVSASTSFRDHSLFLYSWCGFSILPSEFLVLLCFAFPPPLLLWFTCCCLTWRCGWYVNNLFLRTLTCAPLPCTLMPQGLVVVRASGPLDKTLQGFLNSACLCSAGSSFLPSGCCGLQVTQMPSAGRCWKRKAFSVCLCKALWHSRAGLWHGSRMWIVPRFQLSLALCD